MTQQQAQPGDKVRVTGVHVGIVEPDEPGEPGWLRLTREDGARILVKHPSAHITVEVLERADDPSRDLVGTTAEIDGRTYVKAHPNYWKLIHETDAGYCADSYMRGRKVTGTVPGTPAAQAQQTDRDPQKIYENMINGAAVVNGVRKPRVFQPDDPIPADVRKARTALGTVIYRGYTTGRWIYNGGAPVSTFDPEEFPLTEVVEP